MGILLFVKFHLHLKVLNQLSLIIDNNETIC